MTDSFLRQRRNLFIINGILIFACLAKVKISKLTFAGISFSGFGNAAVIYSFLWIILGYFLYRFVVFFLEEEKDKFSNFWVREMSTNVDKKLKTIASKKGDKLNDGSGFSYYHTKENNWLLHYQIYVEGDYGEGSEVVENIKLPILRSQIFFAQLLSILRFCALSPALTNYILPLALSSYVIYTAGFTEWEGSLVAIFT